MTARIAMTFDTYGNTYDNAFFDMLSKGIPGTFFVDPSTVGTANYPHKDNLVLMQACGWEIGIYPGVNMVGLWNSNRMLAKDKLKAVRDSMYSLGFLAKSIAAPQRSWSSPLAFISEDLYDNVRVCDNTVWQTLPVPNRHHVANGGTASWSAADTVASLSAQLDAVITADALWVPIIHRVATSGDPNYTISPTVFQGFTSYLQSKIASGDVKAMTFKDSICLS